MRDKRFRLLSPFRYPGGKSWLVPRVRQWLQRKPMRELIEPFAGGGVVGLTAAFEGLVDRVTLVELDDDIGAVWKTILSADCDWLIEQIGSFCPTPDTVREIVELSGRSVRDRALATIVRNRISRGGILAPGAGVLKAGENGRGLLSRWYPTTLQRRITKIAEMGERLRFVHGDGIAVMAENSKRKRTAFFVDPPYAMAGRRLYLHNDLDHELLMKVASGVRGDILMTYDDSTDICASAERHGFVTRRVPMRTTHHVHKCELLIGRSFDWFTG